VETVSLPFFYVLGSKLNRLAEMDTEENDRYKIFLTAYQARRQVEALFVLFPYLTVCRAAGDELVLAVDKWEKSWVPKLEEKPISVVERIQIRDMATKAKACETVLTAELQTLDTYHPSQKGIYSTRDIIAQAEYSLPGSLRPRLGPGIVEEIRQGGRCLAFDNATACGFHMMRATEAVLHEYYLNVCNLTPQPTSHLKSWGAYLTELRKCSDPHAQEVVALLQQIKDQHRNLIMHPEAVLSDDEAFTLFEVAKAAIIAMASKLPLREESGTGEESSDGS
jgi:hypothetical protein